MVELDRRDPTAVETPRRRASRIRRLGWVPYLLLLPSVAYLALFFASPMVQALALGFTDEQGRPGLASIERMLADSQFWSIAGTTLLLLVAILPVQFALAITMAMLVNSGLRGSGGWLYVYMLPLGISELGAGILWYSIFTEQGWLNGILAGLGIVDQPVLWLDYERRWLVIGTIVVAEAWRATALVMIILLAGLQAIPKDYFEAADVFYASPWQKFWHVTLPLLRPTLRTALILRTVLAFEVFATVIALAGSGLEVLATRANRSYTEFQDPHLAASYGLVILALSVLSTVLFLVLLPVREEQRA